MTRERIEDIREIVLPFVRSVLLKTNYERLGKSDAEEFTRDFNEILDMAIKVLEQEPILDKIRKQIKSDLRGVEIALEVLEKNDPLIPKMEGAKETLENCLEIIDKAESEKRE